MTGNLFFFFFFSRRSCVIFAITPFEGEKYAGLCLSCLCGGFSDDSYVVGFEYKLSLSLYIYKI